MKPNQILKDTFFEVVDNQIRDNDPPEAKETFDRLIAIGISEEDARKHIAQAICIEIWHTLKHQKPFNKERYIGNLKRLPSQPCE